MLDTDQIRLNLTLPEPLKHPRWHAEQINLQTKLLCDILDALRKRETLTIKARKDSALEL